MNWKVVAGGIVLYLLWNWDFSLKLPAPGNEESSDGAKDKGSTDESKPKPPAEIPPPDFLKGEKDELYPNGFGLENQHELNSLTKFIMSKLMIKQGKDYDKDFMEPRGDLATAYEEAKDSMNAEPLYNLMVGRGELTKQEFEHIMAIALKLGIGPDLALNITFDQIEDGIVQIGDLEVPGFNAVGDWEASEDSVQTAEESKEALLGLFAMLQPYKLTIRLWKRGTDEDSDLVKTRYNNMKSWIKNDLTKQERYPNFVVMDDVTLEVAE